MSRVHPGNTQTAQPELDFSSARVDAVGRQPDGAAVYRVIVSPRLRAPGGLMKTQECAADPDLSGCVSLRCIQEAIQRKELKAGRSRLGKRGIWLVRREDWERYKRDCGWIS
jgi:hypothetical protein